MSKVLYIQDSYFRLPDDFNGTCGEALMLMAKRRLEKEKEEKINASSPEKVSNFWDSNEKCMMTYCIDSEDAIKAASMKK